MPAPGPAVASAAAVVATGLERYRLAHRALPGRDLDAVDLATPLLGAVLAAPLVLVVRPGAPVAPLARAATEHGLALVLAEASGLLADPELIQSHQAPDRPPLRFAALRLGALLGTDGGAQAERLVTMLDSDGLVVELDPVGEALRAGGDPRAAGAEAAIAAVVARLTPLPVLVRETGSGLDGADARALAALGVAAVDVGGAGARAVRDRGGAGQLSFDAWGVPLADAVAEAALLAPGLPLIAGGPLRDGIEAAICIALGATAAAPALAVDAESVAALVRQLRVAVWATGSPSAAALHAGHLRDARADRDPALLSGAPRFAPS